MVNVTNNDSSGINSLFKFINNSVDGLFFPSVLLAIWVVIFTNLLGFSPPRAWLTASLVCSFLAIPLTILGYMSAIYLYLLIVLTGAGFIWVKLGT